MTKIFFDDQNFSKIFDTLLVYIYFFSIYDRGKKVMPRRFVRRRVSRRGGVRRRSFKSRAYSRRSSKNGFRAARRRRAIGRARAASRIQNLLNVESKSSGGVYSTDDWHSGATTSYPLIADSLLTVGMTTWNRLIGNQVTMKGLFFTLNFTPGSTQASPVCVTFALVRTRNDLRNTNMAPAASDVWDYNSVASSAPPSAWVRRRGWNMAGYGTAQNVSPAGPAGTHKVIMVKRFMVHPAASQSVGYRPYRKFLLRLNHRLVTNAQAAIFSSHCSPEYTIMGWSDNATGTTAPQVIVTYKYIYVDM